MRSRSSGIGKTRKLDSLWPDDCYGVKNARTATMEPNEQGAVANANAIGVVRAAAGH
jgi:hypothetical protein